MQKFRLTRDTDSGSLGRISLPGRPLNGDILIHLGVVYRCGPVVWNAQEDMPQLLVREFRIDGLLPTYKDGEVLGVDENGAVVQWNADEKAPYTSGAMLDSFNMQSLSDKEKERCRVGL